MCLPSVIFQVNISTLDSHRNAKGQAQPADKLIEGIPLSLALPGENFNFIFSVLFGYSLVTKLNFVLLQKVEGHTNSAAFFLYRIKNLKQVLCIYL